MDLKPTHKILILNGFNTIVYCAILFLFLSAIGFKILDFALFNRLPEFFLNVDLASLSITPGKVIQAVLFAIFFMWLANYIVDLFKRYAQSLKIHPSNRVLLVNSFNTSIYFLIFLLFIGVLGIRLTHFAALTFLSGTIAVVIGFGFQRISSNFISGIILLFEKSIKVGDLLQLDEKTFGYIRNTGAIYTLVEAFDGREILVPNEAFITGRVINWTHSNKSARIEIAFTVSHNADLDIVRTLLMSAAAKHHHCSREKEIRFLIREFTETGILVSVDFWIDDVTLGRNTVRSEVMFSIWRSLKDHGIAIPAPRRHVKHIEE